MLQGLSITVHAFQGCRSRDSRGPLAGPGRVPFFRMHEDGLIPAFVFALGEATAEEVATKLKEKKQKCTAAKAAAKKKDAKTGQEAVTPATGDTPIKSPPKKVLKGKDVSSTSPEGSEETQRSKSTVQRRLRFKAVDPDPISQIKALQEADGVPGIEAANVVGCNLLVSPFIFQSMPGK